MSTLDEKLGTRVVRTESTAAQRPLSSLRACRGYAVLDGDASSPTRVRICPMDTVSTWRRLSGPGSMFVVESA